MLRIVDIRHLIIERRHPMYVHLHLNLPFIFVLVVTIMTIFWHVKNMSVFRQSSSSSLRLAQVDLMGAHAMSLVGLLVTSLGVPVWESPRISNPWSFWLIAGLLVLLLAAVMKMRVVKALPDNLWHFTERNRQLVAKGKIAQFHLENELAALTPMLVLVWLAHHLD